MLIGSFLKFPVLKGITPQYTDLVLFFMAGMRIMTVREIQKEKE